MRPRLRPAGVARGVGARGARERLRLRRPERRHCVQALRGVTMREPEDSPRHWCYGCGDRNPEGLHIVFEVDGRRVSGRFQPRETHRGWPGFAHGGVAAAALDEAMGWATWAAGALSMTARMGVKYRRPLPLGEDLV